MRKNLDEKAVKNYLYRATSLKTDKIVYGKDLYYHHIRTDGNIISKCFLVKNLSPFDEDDEEVDIESVEVNTGYLDGNNNPIFEGDYLILKYSGQKWKVIADDTWRNDLLAVAPLDIEHRNSLPLDAVNDEAIVCNDIAFSFEKLACITAEGA